VCVQHLSFIFSYSSCSRPGLALDDAVCSINDHISLSLLASLFSTCPPLCPSISVFTSSHLHSPSSLAHLAISLFLTLLYLRPVSASPGSTTFQFLEASPPYPIDLPLTISKLARPNHGSTFLKTQVSRCFKSPHANATTQRVHSRCAPAYVKSGAFVCYIHTHQYTVVNVV
jgi:hypothetical protein